MNKSFIVPLITVLMTTTSVNPVKAAAREQEVPASTPEYTIQFNTASPDVVSPDSIQLTSITVGSPLTLDQPATPKSLQDTAEEIVNQKFGPGYFTDFSKLVFLESSWNPNAINRTSGACGLGQALPCSRMTDKSPVGQINWMVSYISDRYGNPAKALAFHNAHHYY